LANLKEDRYASNPSQACAPPGAGKPQQRIALTNLWANLPTASQHQAVIALCGMIARQLDWAAADAEAAANHDGARSLPALLGKEAGDEAR
jgi:hypothetical protein